MRISVKGCLYFAGLYRSHKCGQHEVDPKVKYISQWHKRVSSAESTLHYNKMHLSTLVPWYTAYHLSQACRMNTSGTILLTGSRIPF